MDEPRVDDLLTSFAQHGEDVVLHRLFGARAEGFYVDVGANDPVVDSVTHLFSRRGWRGVNVEPLPWLHQRLVVARPRDVNLAVAVSDRAGTLALEEVTGAPGLSTATPALAEAYRERGQQLHRREVPCVTLAALCEAHCGGQVIDFLKVDVEGHEAEVLRGGDWRRFRPRVLLLEVGYAADVTHALATGAGYQLGLDDGLNRFYVRDEDAAAWLPRLAAPANVTDRYLRADLARAVLDGREWDALGPVIQGLARRLAALKDANPRLKAGLKRALRFAQSRVRMR